MLLKFNKYIPGFHIVKTTLSVVAVFVLSSGVFSQNEVYQYARKIVDTMASESMHGRGYVNNGDQIAANYIRAEFQKFGLLSFNGGYYQQVDFPVNTFPGNMALTADHKKLQPGKDFIVACANPSASGKYSTCYADDELVNDPVKLKKFKEQDFSNKIIIVNDTGKETSELKDIAANNLHAIGIIMLKDKLTWSVAGKQNNYSAFEVLRSAMTRAKKITFSVDAKMIPDHQSQNVIGFVKGSDQPDSFIVFSAHYDHLGQMGKKVFFPGANDNASGSAMLLNLARHYATTENKPKYSIVFIAFCGEEAGLLGSAYFTEHPLFPMKNIRFLLNMDIMGTGEEGITVVNGSVFKTEFDQLKEINAKDHLIKDVKIRGKAANSDHYFFAEKGVKACFIYTMGGIKAYHDVYDRPETLPLNEFENLFKLITKFGDYLQR